MGEIEYSAGPWSVRQDVAGTGKSMAVISRTGAVVALMKHAHSNKSANARLIAAAPDLLAALKVLVAVDAGAWHPERHAREKAEAIAYARAAIAKATAPISSADNTAGAGI
jgi:hypothetical protein